MADEKSGLDVAMDALEGEIKLLGESAELLCKRHLDYVMAQNKSRDWGSKSTLFAQTRMRGYGLTANWYEVRWYGSKITNTRRMTKRLIVRPKVGYSYTAATLAKQSQPWELDMVREVETEMVEIRRRAFFIAKALSSLNHLDRKKSK